MKCRYLYHLLQTRITHLERIRRFLIRKMRGNVGLVGENALEEVVKAAEYIEFLMCEATAYRDFAYGLFCVRKSRFSTGLSWVHHSWCTIYSWWFH